jgi:hypothetical protein
MSRFFICVLAMDCRIMTSDEIDITRLCAWLFHVLLNFVVGGIKRIG